MSLPRSLGGMTFSSSCLFSISGGFCSVRGCLSFRSCLACTGAGFVCFRVYLLLDFFYCTNFSCQASSTSLWRSLCCSISSIFYRMTTSCLLLSSALLARRANTSSLDSGALISILLWLISFNFIVLASFLTSFLLYLEAKKSFVTGTERVF